MWIYILWCVGIVLTAGAACRMASLGLTRELPTLWVYLAGSAVFWTALLVTRPDRAVYLGVYSAGVPLVLLAKCGAVVAIFWSLTRNYPSFRLPGSVFLAAFSALGVVAAWVTAFLAQPVHADRLAAWLWHVALLVERYTSVALLALLLSIVLLLPRSPDIPLPKFAVRAAFVMATDAALGVLAAWGEHSLAFRNPTAAALIATGYGSLIGSAWLLLVAFDDVPLAQSPSELRCRELEIANELRTISARIDETYRQLKSGE
jgi:hypothetical protein